MLEKRATLREKLLVPLVCDLEKGSNSQLSTFSELFRKQKFPKQGVGHHPDPSQADLFYFWELFLIYFGLNKISCRIFPSQQSPIFDGVIDKQITPFKLSADEDAAVRKIGLQYAKGLLKNRYEPTDDLYIILV